MGAKAREDLRLKMMLQETIEKYDPNIQNKIFLNGHFYKTAKFYRKATTYYVSYVLSLDPIADTIDVYRYFPKTKEAELIGIYSSN